MRTSHHHPIHRFIALLLALTLLLAACTPPSDSSEDEATANEESTVLGNPAYGPQHILNYGCGTCHMIPGVIGADGQVGPSLANFAQRRIIAGSLVNTPENAISWIQNPQALHPGTTMPNVNATAEDIADMVAYLYTLE